MKPQDLVLKGYAKRCDGVWVAICLDFGLAAQGNSVEEAMRRLTDQIQEHLYDALVGEDQEHFEYLLKHRKAPLSQWVEYYWLNFLTSVHVAKQNMAKIFDKPFPLPIEAPSRQAT